MNWNAIPRPARIYGLMLAMLAACTLLGIALAGAVTLGWPDGLVTAIGATGLLLGMTSAIVFDRSGLAEESAAARKSDRAHDAWTAARQAGADAETLAELYDEWRHAYAAEARARRGEG